MDSCYGAEVLKHIMTIDKKISVRYRGCLLGLAIGDALGSRLEGYSPQAVKSATIDRDEFLDELWQWSHGRWTDDTKMAIALAESIVEMHGFNPEHIAKNYLKWYESGDLRGIGKITLIAMQNLKDGASWDTSGVEEDWAAGNGTAMRAAPLGLLAAGDMASIANLAADDAKITHNNREAINGSHAVALAVAKLVHGKTNVSDLIPRIIDSLEPCEVLLRLEIAQKLFEQKVEPVDGLADIGTSGYVVETVAAAFYCFVTSPNSYGQVVYNAIRGGNDTDTTAAIAGALSGAYLGIAGIPLQWREQVEDGRRIESIADRVLELVSAL